MAGKKYLLDTNHLGLAVTPGSNVGQRLAEQRKQGALIGTCVPILCELEVGIHQVREPERYRKGLRRLLSAVRMWPIDLETAQTYGEIYHELKNKGRVLSQVDMIAVALARQMKLVLLTTDRDFEALPDIDTDSWKNTA